MVLKESRLVAEEYLKKAVKNQFLYTPNVQVAVSDCEMSTFTLPKFICIGDSIRIIGGSYIGMVGRVVELNQQDSVVVDLRVLDAVTHRSNLLNTKLKHIARRFNVGDCVEVKIGKLFGRIGIVAIVEGNVLTVVQPHHLCEVRTKYYVTICVVH